MADWLLLLFVIGAHPINETTAPPQMLLVSEAQCRSVLLSLTWMRHNAAFCIAPDGRRVNMKDLTR